MVNPTPLPPAPHTPEAKAREQIDDQLVACGWVIQDYKAADFDRSVVVPDHGAAAEMEQPQVDPRGERMHACQIRTVLRTYRDAVATVPRPSRRPTTIRRRRTRSVGVADTLFPGRTLVPKTLIFAKDDSHAEDIVHLCREVFGRGNDFCKKITYQAKHPVTGRPAKSKELIKVSRPRKRPTSIRRRRTQRGGEADTFCLSPTLRIAVTVDMIATGTDIKPLEVLIFLRDPASRDSRVYFEQMQGCGTRVLTATDSQSVSGEEARAETRFNLAECGIDAVVVCDAFRQHENRVEERCGTARDQSPRLTRLGKQQGRIPPARSPTFGAAPAAFSASPAKRDDAIRISPVSTSNIFRISRMIRAANFRRCFQALSAYNPPTGALHG